MDQASQQQGTVNSGSGAGGGGGGEWGSMGGSPGDGISTQQQQQPLFSDNYGEGLAQPQQYPPQPQQLPPPPPNQQQQQQPPSTPYQQQQQQPYTPGSGSITRFATPDMHQQQPGAAAAATPPAGGSSYAARSAQQQQAYGNYQQPQQQQQYTGAPTAGGGPSSYAARSAQAQAQQQQPTTTTTTMSSASSAAGGYAARSAQAYASHQPQTPTVTITPSQPSQAGSGDSSFAARSAQAYASQQQQQQQQQQPSMAAPSGGGGGSYAARSAQAYSTQQPQQPQSQQPPMSSSSSAGPYAARSAQAYGASQQQQQQQQQPYASGASVGTTPPSQATASPSYGGYGSMPQPQAQPGYSQQQQQQQQQQQPGMMGGGIPQQQQQPGMSNVYGQQQPNAASTVVTTATGTTAHRPTGQETPQAQAQQQRWLTEATRKVQEHAYYMRQAMDQNNLPVVLDRAAHMVGELGGPPHGHHHHHHAAAVEASGGGSGPSNTGLSAKLNPKNYYELYMRALEDMSTFEDYVFNLAEIQHDQQPQVPEGTIQIVDSNPAGATHIHHHAAPRKLTMRELYDCTQYCPRVVSRLYLQIAAGSALMKSKETGSKWVLNDLAQAVRCEQNPIRGLFVRHYLLQALRSKLPDTPPVQQQPPPPPGDVAMGAASTSGGEATQDATAVIEEHEQGTVQDSYEFVLGNFMEMNKLWVRIQHLPGEGRNKDVRKRRERERNDLRLLVGTNLVRLSQLECVTSKIYGEIILPQILEHVVVCGDPLSQAYLMDCLVQVFPDEYHIETLPILLNVCPRLRDKVNIRTILQGLMDRLANYLADEELLDESDTNQVKKELARDSFGMFEDCVQKVYNARGPKLTSKEVIRLQTALLQFSLKCYPGNLEQINRCLGVCITALRQANASYDAQDGAAASNVLQDDRGLIRALDEASVAELEKLLSIPLDSLALKVLELEQYSDLLRFLPWSNRREVAMSMLKAVDNAGAPPRSIKEIEELFSVIEPVIRDENASAQTMPRDESSTARATSLMAGLGVNQSPHTSFAYENEVQKQYQQQPSAYDQRESVLVSKLVHVLDHEDPDVLFEMLNIARNHISRGGPYRASQTLVAVVFASLKLAQKLFKLEAGLGRKAEEPVVSKEESTTAEVESSKKEESPATGETVNADEDTSATPETSKLEDKDKVDETKDDEVKEESPAEAAPDNVPERKEEEPATATDELEAGGDGPGEAEDTEVAASNTRSISCRKVFVFIQETIAMISKGNAETGVKLFLELSLAADAISTAAENSASVEATEYVSIAYELLSQSYTLYEENITDTRAQQRCIRLLIGTLLSSSSLSKEDYERLITKTAQFAAKVVKKTDQCQLVALCANLFYPTDNSRTSARYSNPQRALECLQRSLKLADACTSANPSNVQLFVDLLEHYVFFFEKKNPVVTHNFITGLMALIKEHLSNVESFQGGDVLQAKGQFLEVVRYVKRKKNEEATAELFAPIQVDNIGA